MYAIYSRSPVTRVKSILDIDYALDQRSVERIVLNNMQPAVAVLIYLSLSKREYR